MVDLRFKAIEARNSFVPSNARWWCLLALAVANPSIYAQTVNHESQDIPLAEFDIASKGDLIMLPVTLGHERFLFLLDSGSTHHAFDSSLEQRLISLVGDNFVSSKANGSVPVKLFRLPKARIGELTLTTRKKAVLIDLSRLKQACGKDVRGLVGVEFFLDHVVQIDFDAGILRVYPRGKLPTPSWGVSVPLGVDWRGLPSATLRIDDRDEDVTLDTGFTGTLNLNTLSFTRLLMRQKVDLTRSTFSTTAKGEVQRRSGRIEAISFGPFRHRSVVASDAPKNVLGLTFLSRYQVTIDCSGAAMYLRKGMRFDERDQLDMSGIHLKWIDDLVTICSVDEASPAEQAGIKKGDTLLDAFGKRVKPTDILEIRRQLSSENGRLVPLRIRRNGVESSLSFRLSESWGN